MPIFDILLLLHILAGTISLTAAVAAVSTKTLNVSHRWHIYAGQAFFWGMLGVFLTAIPMALIRASLFLVLIAVFSLYLAFAGWRLAKNRRGTPALIDWLRGGIMVAAAAGMIGLGTFLVAGGDSNGITLLVFGGIGALTSLSDLRTLRSGGVSGRARVADHLAMMLGATIATVTAFVVVNFTFEPAFVLWLGPTVIITPVIVWWRKRLEAGVRPRGMP